MKSGLWTPPPVPRQHGAWAMMSMPLLLGLAAAGSASVAALLVAPAVILTFLARNAAVPAAEHLLHHDEVQKGYFARRFLWSGIYLAAGFSCLAVAVLQSPAPEMAPAIIAALATGLFGGIHTMFALVGRDRALAGQIAGMFGLASSVPLTIAVAGAPLNGAAGSVAVLALVYCLSSLVYVRGYKATGQPTGPLCAGAQTAMAALLVGLWMVGWLPALALVALVPLLLRDIWAFFRPPPNLRVLGFREIRVAVGFAVLATLALV